jgi:hypothetical protein
MIKPIDEFYQQRAKNGKRYLGYCFSCASEKNKEWRQNNPERARRNDFLSNLRDKGLTESQFLNMREEQYDLCMICGEPQECIDHDHKTGKVRGLLCNHCNHGLGKFKDSPALLVAAAMYLRGQEVQPSF